MLWRLSKIAHIAQNSDCDTGSVRRLNSRNLGVSGRIERRTNIVRNARLSEAHKYPGIIKFSPTLEANSVGTFFEGEHTTQMTVMAGAKGELEDPQ
jgi:hypothetical protein